MEQQEISFQVHIDGIELIEKILNRAVVEENQIFKFDVTAQTILDAPKQLIVVFVKASFFKENEDNLLGSVTIAVGFKIENFNSIFKPDEEGKILIPSEVEQFLRTIAISTSRGVIFSEFRGTPLHKAYLPIILTNAMVQKPEAAIIK